jgi:predicted metalloendopeptidase
MTSAHESALSVRRHGRDESVRPQDDLFGHVNGGWLATAEIPADLTSIGVDVDLALRAESQTAAVLRDAVEVVASGRAPIGSIDQKLGDLFSSFMDEAAVEERVLGRLQMSSTRLLRCRILGPLLTSSDPYSVRGLRVWLGCRSTPTTDMLTVASST